MSRMTQALAHQPQAARRKAALAVLALAAACLPGCAQTSAARHDSAQHNAATAGKQGPGLMPTVDFASCSKPVWPEGALAKPLQGTTTMRFLIDTNGAVVQSAVLTSSGDASLDEAARVAIARCRFRPAVHAGSGAPQRAWVLVQYVWTL